MRIFTSNRRRIRKKLRTFSPIIRDFWALPLVKPALMLIASLCILLIITPYMLTQLFPADGHKNDTSPPAGFQAIDIPETVTVYRSDSEKTETIDLEEYIKGVVSCEMPAGFHIEALKAQSVAARTYSVSKIIRSESEGNPADHPDAPLCDTTHCQVYKSEEQLKSIKGDEWMKNGWKKICQAVEQTEGQLLYYDGQLVQQALFHSSSGGKTENSEDVFAAAVPYLVSVDSPYEENATHQNEKNSFSIKEFTDAIKKKYPDISIGTVTSDNTRILSRSSGGNVKDMQVGNAVLSGRDIREALGLPSAGFSIDISDDSITFTSSGSGHGVGMSQYGADGMAENGYDYREILSHYYSGTEVY